MSRPRVLIGYSACPLTRETFERAGCDAWTCDLLPARDGSPKHFQCDVWDVAGGAWAAGVFHPMCTFLTTSAAWAFTDGPYHQKVKPSTLVGADRRAARLGAFANFRRLLALPYAKAIENPARSFLNKEMGGPTQVVQPYEFGDNASKATGLWLDGLPPLAPFPWARVPGRLVGGKERWANQTDSGQNRVSPGPSRWLERSATYPGIAAAMGAQWGAFLCA